MDTSVKWYEDPVYIKMCDCEEIQDIWRNIEDVSLLPSYVYDTTTKSVAIMIWTPNKLAGIIRKEHPSQGNTLIASIEWWDEKNIGYEDDQDLWRQDTIWLPTQSQLQEMVGGFEKGFIDWWNWRNVVYPHMQNPFNQGWRFTSWEQLWLAFVQKELHQKVWNGTGWTKGE